MTWRRMELTGLAVKTGTVVVPDTVGYVRSLLYFGDETAFANGVNTSGRKEENISLVYVVPCKDIYD